MVDIQVNDIILEEGRFYKVVFIDENSKTMDLRCYNAPLYYRGVPIANINDPKVQILKELPKNVKFLFIKTFT